MKAKLGSIVSFTLLFCVTAISRRAQADPVVPVVTLEVDTPIPEGSPTIAMVTVMNPDATRNLTISEIIVALNGFEDDLTDRLTLTGARVNLAGCRGVAVRGILAGTGNLVLAPETSCTDNIVVPSLALTEPDEGKPDSGTTTVNASAVTPDGVHSIIQTEDVVVEDPRPIPEPATFMTLGGGLLALSWKLKARIKN